MDQNSTSRKVSRVPTNFIKLEKGSSFEGRYSFTSPFQGQLSQIHLKEGILLNRTKLDTSKVKNSENLIFYPGALEVYILLEGSFDWKSSACENCYFPEGSVVVLKNGDCSKYFKMNIAGKYRFISMNLDPTLESTIKNSSTSITNYIKDLNRGLKKQSFTTFMANPTILKKAEEIYSHPAKNLFDLFQLQKKSKSLVSTLLHKLSENAKNQNTVAESILKQIQAHPTYSPHLLELRDTLGLSSYLLNKIFFQTYGLTIKAQIRRIRLDAASKALTHSNAPIFEVARSIGFDNPSKFSKFFRDAKGLNPNQYRKSFRKSSKQS